MHPFDRKRPTLGYGSTGEDVITLQRLLNKWGFSVAVDGNFDIETQNAVFIFQQCRELTPDGLVAPLTWLALEGIPIGDIAGLRQELAPTRTVTRKEKLKEKESALNERIRKMDNVPTVDVIGSKVQGADSYVSTLIKYIPSEILVFYITLRSFVLSVEPVDQNLGWLIFLFGSLITPVYRAHLRSQELAASRLSISLTKQKSI